MNKKSIYKIFSYLIVLIIFFFLGKVFFENWEKIKDYDFSFNYFYLIISFIFLSIFIIGSGLIWNKILRILEPNKKITNFCSLKIIAYSWFGKYLPGKAWMFIGRVYLGEKEGLNRKKLIISVIYEIILSIISAFLFSLILLSISLGIRLSYFYIFLPIIILVALLLIHPRVFYALASFILRKFKKIEISLTDFLSYWNIVQIILFYFIIYSLEGIGFFFLVKSFTFVPFNDIIGMVGLFIFASVLGTVAIFAPSGLGVKEGVLVVFLQAYFPLSIAILISLITRIWATLGEIIFFICIYLYSQLKKRLF